MPQMDFLMEQKILKVGIKNQKKTTKENYFNQLCALYSNGQRVEVKEFITGFGDKEFLKRLNLQECRDSLNELLKEKTGSNIEEDIVELAEPIKHIGSHTIELELAPGITTQVVIDVKAE